METNYKKVIVIFDLNETIVTFKKPQTYKELLTGIGDAFYRGAHCVKLYPDFRKKSEYLHVKKEDFTPDDIEQLHIENTLNLKIKRLEDLIKINENEIVYRTKRIDELRKEIKKLVTKQNT